MHGHRGARVGRLAENTIPAFEYAIACGADAIEMDLAVTRDNVVVISHDPALADGAAIRACRAAELPQLNTLDQALKLADRGAFLFNLEIKSFPDHPEFGPPPDKFARLVRDRIRAHGLERRSIVQSFDFRTLPAMRELAPEIRLSALTEDDPRPYPLIAQAAGGTEMVSPQLRLVTPAKVAEAHAAGLAVMAWTANTPAEWEALLAAGVDAIITDDPAALIAWLAEHGPAAKPSRRD